MVENALQVAATCNIQYVAGGLAGIMSSTSAGVPLQPHVDFRPLMGANFFWGGGSLTSLSTLDTPSFVQRATSTLQALSHFALNVSAAYEASSSNGSATIIAGELFRAGETLANTSLWQLNSTAGTVRLPTINPTFAFDSAFTAMLAACEQSSSDCAASGTTICLAAAK